MKIKRGQIMSSKTRILVVDDEKDFCQNIKDILELRDYEVTVAYDGFQALELIRQNTFDLILMDVKMPAMNGVETFKKIKEIAPDISVIMVTAYAVEDLIREALREGAFGILKKPMNLDRLFPLIEKATQGGGLILIVDDDRDLADNLKSVLTEKGFQVMVAFDGDMAEQKAREAKFDIILLDMKLPPLNGLETYMIIRDIRPQVVAILITGYPHETNGLVQQALREEAYLCLEKPIAMDMLIGLLEKIMRQKAEDHIPIVDHD